MQVVVSGMDVGGARSRRAIFQGFLYFLKNGTYNLPTYSEAHCQKILEKLILTLESCSDTQSIEHFLIIEAAQHGSPVFARQLLAAGIGPKISETIRQATKGWTPLSMGARCGHLSIVRLLVASGAEVNRPIARSPLGAAGDCSALLAAAEVGHKEIVRFLLDAGADVNQVGWLSGETPLIVAALNGHLEATKMLVEAGADIKVAQGEGCTALFAAAKGDHFGVVRYLLERGANPNVTCVDGATPLISACAKAGLGVIRLLVEAGADPSAVMDGGVTPLRMAFGRSVYSEAVEYLLDMGARDDMLAVRDTCNLQLSVVHWLSDGTLKHMSFTGVLIPLD